MYAYCYGFMTFIVSIISVSYYGSTTSLLAERVNETENIVEHEWVNDCIDIQYTANLS